MRTNNAINTAPNQHELTKQTNDLLQQTLQTNNNNENNDNNNNSKCHCTVL